MKAEQLNALAVRILRGDANVNVILGVIFIAIPDTIEDVLASAPLIPFIIWRVIGVIFILYAVWEVIVVRRPPLSASSLAFASMMALVPVVLLTTALLFGDFALRPLGYILLWIGDAVMLLLGSYYAQVMWRMRRERDRIN